MDLFQHYYFLSMIYVKRRPRILFERFKIIYPWLLDYLLLYRFPCKVYLIWCKLHNFVILALYLAAIIKSPWRPSSVVVYSTTISNIMLKFGQTLYNSLFFQSITKYNLAVFIHTGFLHIEPAQTKLCTFAKLPLGSAVGRASAPCAGGLGFKSRAGSYQRL